MTPKVNYFEQIEDYCFELLSDKAKLQFETELKLDAELRSEVKLMMEIQSAIAEKDVTNLRDKLKKVASQSKITDLQDDSFELLNEFSDIHEINHELSSEDLINFFDSMPKVHVHQHEITTNENTHQFYKEQNKPKINVESDEINDIDFEEFKGIEEAILEKDIISLRQTLAQVAKSMEPKFSVEEIDAFLNGGLTEVELEVFENELANNRDLKEEVKLHRELEKAIQENEIISLRNQVSQITATETSWNVSGKNIEDYIDGELEDALLLEFNAELEVNSDLMAEVELRRQINGVIGESDIRKLRAELKDAKELAEMNKVRNLIPITGNKFNKFLRTSVAIIVLLIGVAGVLNSGYLSVDRTYDKFFESPSWAAERSVSADLTLLKEAQGAFMAEDYLRVIDMKKMVTVDASNNPVFQFYTGASFQKMDKFKNAIADYTLVINHGDNLFVEEAEWYRSLCYMRLGDKMQAKQELLAVVNRNGFFKQDAKAVLRRLKFARK